MVCVDTDFLIDLDRQNKDALSKMKEFESEGELVCTTVINAAEYYAGAFRSKGKNALEHAQSYLNDFALLVLDEQSAFLWGKLYNELKSNSIGERDLFIASIVLSNKQTLITKNVKHFERVPGLDIESWSTTHTQ